MLSRFTAAGVSLLLSLASQQTALENTCMYPNPHRHTHLYLFLCLSTYLLKSHVFILIVGCNLPPCLICNFFLRQGELAHVTYNVFMSPYLFNLSINIVSKLLTHNPVRNKFTNRRQYLCRVLFVCSHKLSKLFFSSCHLPSSGWLCSFVQFGSPIPRYF